MYYVTHDNYIKTHPVGTFYRQYQPAMESPTDSLSRHGVPEMELFG